jgi:hypothetical protein
MAANAGSEAETERAGFTSGSALPSIPKVQGPCCLGLRFPRVTHPEQFKVAVGETETTASCPLPWMSIRFAFDQAELLQATSLLTPEARTNKDVV